MNEQVVTLLVAVLGGGFLGSAVQGFYQRKKLGADYADVIARSATGLLKPLSDRVEELQIELTATQRQLKEERVKVRVLVAELGDARDEMTALRRELNATRRENRPRRGEP